MTMIEPMIGRATNRIVQTVVHTRHPISFVPSPGPLDIEPPTTNELTKTSALEMLDRDPLMSPRAAPACGHNRFCSAGMHTSTIPAMAPTAGGLKTYRRNSVLVRRHILCFLVFVGLPGTSYSSLSSLSRSSIDGKPHADLVKYPTGMDPSRGGVADLRDFFFGNGDDHTSKDSDIQVMCPGLQDYGGLEEYSGQAVTIKCYESNPLVRKTLNENGEGKVLVIDGGTSMECALIGDLLSELAVQRGWSGIIVNGCVRDTSQIGGMDVGIKALAAMPLKPGKRDMGKLNVPVNVCGVIIRPGNWIYADTDGFIVSPTELKLPEGGSTDKTPLTIPE